MALLGIYLLFGLGVYTGIACSRLHTFKGASTFSIVKGLILGFLLWPVGLAVVITKQENNRE